MCSQSLTGCLTSLGWILGWVTMSDVVLKQLLTRVHLERARENNHRCLVGAFHGHAHNRLCQSCFLTTYIEGLGLEDLEGCERFFAKSHALASGTRYASTFHRCQAISEYALFTDKFETYANLSKLSVHAADHILIFICLYCRY